MFDLWVVESVRKGRGREEGRKEGKKEERKEGRKEAEIFVFLAEVFSKKKLDWRVRCGSLSDL